MKRFFLMLFAVFFMSFSGAVAQDWEWSQPKVITPDSAYVDIEFYPDYTEVNGSDDWITYAPLAFAGTKASTLMFSDDTISGNGIKSVFAPPFLLLIPTCRYQGRPPAFHSCHLTGNS